MSTRPSPSSFLIGARRASAKNIERQGAAPFAERAASPSFPRTNIREFKALERAAKKNAGLGGRNVALARFLLALAPR
jgi:hypothetical protein